ncbi:LysR family transcriptional regulator [Parafrankia sp. BMG5.11]|uniref:LysR family transcriptional regulator n=1 Tax=Parafrankia sp. BMG5.11 TaxID=222540 RepID=UPI00103E3ED7|nr:LysR substrate-binding domain-containing protein [Parafrankia sp. BMG5.11]TCJ41404.1 LysR family transcriptional regulator [Parafrankia sp. BMG5.11]
MQEVDAFAMFAKVGELGSISGAARSLSVPKANVSRAVVRLEAAYKVALVDRTGRRIRLTEAGVTFHARCLRILDEMNEAQAELAAHRGHPAGTLRIGFPGDVGRDMLADTLHEFLERYPDIDLRVRVGERLLPQPNSLDVVLHAGWLSDSRLTCLKLADIRTLLVASRGYVKRRGLPTSSDDLAGHSFLGNFYLDRASIEPGRLPAHVPVLELKRETERFALPIWQRFASTDHMLMLDLVKRGIAIAPIAAARITDELRSGELVRVLPDYELHNPPALYALYIGRAAIAPKLKVFLEFLQEIIARQRQNNRASRAQR